jgi:glyoxylase-like metal-dependent hydrolase (beta-lactamase superfamily II)
MSRNTGVKEEATVLSSPIRHHRDEDENPLQGGVYDVTQVTYGERLTSKSAVFHGFAATGEPDAEQRMDYSFWIAQDEHRVVLVDTGYDIDARDWLGESSLVSPLEALGLLGIEPAQVRAVVATHFHYDHVGTIGEFPNAVIIAARAEFDYWVSRYHDNRLEGEFATVEDVTAIMRAGDEGRLHLVNETEEVLPGITVYPVGGHCPGQLLTSVKSTSGPLILASDAIHLGEQLQRGWPFFAHTNLDEMRAAIEFARKLSTELGASVIPGHEPRVRAEYPAVPGPAADIAVTLG